MFLSIIIVAGLIFLLPYIFKTDVKLEIETTKDFLPGDSIEITEILGATGKIETGQTYTIKGKYKLASQDSAKLHLYATNGETTCDQGPTVNKGQGEFTRTFTYQKEGWLHLSYYPAKGGSSFGNLYFSNKGGYLPNIQQILGVTSKIGTARVKTPGKESVEIGIEPGDLNIRLDSQRNLYNLVVSIHNTGNVNLPRFKLRYYRGDPKHGLDESGKAHSGWHNAGPIEPGKRWNERTRDFPLVDGQYEFHVILDYDNNVPEINENNNEAVLYVEISNGQIMKIKPTASRVKRQIDSQGGKFSIPIEIDTTTRFLPGDSIEITEIVGKTGKIEAGQTYMIKGKYKLSSRNEAQIHFLSTNGSTCCPHGPTIKRGIGEFTRTLNYIEGNKDTWLQAKFCPVDGNDSFGDLYFYNKNTEKR